MKKTVTYLILFFSSFFALAQNSVQFIQANNSSVKQVNNAPVVIIPKSNKKTTDARTTNNIRSSPNSKHRPQNCQHSLKRIGPCDNNQKKVLKDPVK